MDGALLLALKAVRMAAYGMTMMVLVPFLLELGLSDSEVGLFMTLTLLGDVLLSAYITRVADQAGRRFMLGLSSVLMLLSGVCFMFCTNYTILLVAAVVGVVSPSGDEVGPFRAIEESAIAQITNHSNRSRFFAAQNLVGTLGLGLGALGGGFLASVFKEKTGKDIDAYRVVFAGYMACALLSFVACAGLSSGVELPSARAALEREARLAFAGANETSASAAETSEVATTASEGGSTGGGSTGGGSTGGSTARQQRGDMSDITTDAAAGASTAPTISTRVASISENGAILVAHGAPLLYLLALFGIDSLAYGFMPNSWLVEYLFTRYQAGSVVVASFMFMSSAVSALTSYPSAYLTDAIGSVAAICLTKLGAGLFGALVPAAGALGSAMGLVWLRSFFDTMDVVPRQVFITSIVPEEDRTRVLGLINIVKTLARAAGPTFTGLLAAQNKLWVCFLIMGGLEWVFAGAVYTAYRTPIEYGDIRI